MTIKSGHGLTGWVTRNRRPLVNARPSADFEAAGLAPTSTGLQVGDCLAAGVQRPADRHAGRLSGRRRRLHRRPPPAARPGLRTGLGRDQQLPVVFERTQEDSLTDALTGLPNTRFMFIHLTRELARAERLKSEVALLVMDCDNFKDINDNHGHHVGDRALREVANVLRGGVRPYDICVRYAGDEFIVVLSGCGAEEAERKRLELQAGDGRRGVRGRGRGGASTCRSASARRSTRTTARPTRRCSPPATPACTATRPRASSWRRPAGARVEGPHRVGDEASADAARHQRHRDRARTGRGALRSGARGSGRTHRN